MDVATDSTTAFGLRIIFSIYIGSRACTLLSDAIMSSDNL